jgi:ComF family protein
MTSLLEKIVAIIAPHTCISCSKQDNVWCDVCIKNEHTPLPPICLVCGRKAIAWGPCAPCTGRTALSRLWAASAYDGPVKEIIHKLKFERVGGAHEPLAKIMLQTLPKGDWLVMPAPTAPRRMRMRGYDQAALLAKYIANARDLAHSPALFRVQDVRQVGKNRMQRQKQSTQMFAVARRRDVQGAHILLVDDVCTTASTLTAAAQILRAAGASQVDAVVAAWQPPKA